MKKKRVFKLLIMAWAFLTIGCNKYKIVGDKVYFISWNEANGRNEILVDEAKGESFKQLKNSQFAVDNDHVFYNYTKLEDADPKTFVVLADNFGKDKNYVYVCSLKIIGAESKNFEILEISDYEKDSKDYYLNGTPLNVNDINSFKILNKIEPNSYWAKEKTHYYWGNEKHLLADYESFINIGNGYAKDKFKVYFQDSVILNADVETFKTTAYGAAEDKNAKYQANLKSQ
jgi:hypothetical protein